MIFCKCFSIDTTFSSVGANYFILHNEMAVSGDKGNKFNQIPFPDKKTAENLKDKQKDVEEIADFQTEWKSDGSVALNFSSHGRRHQLELSESKLNLSQLPIKFLGFNESEEQNVRNLLKVIKCFSVFNFKDELIELTDSRR